MNAISVACSHGDFLAGRSWRDDNCAVAVVEYNVGAIGLGEARRALEEFFGIHDGRDETEIEVSGWGLVNTFSQRRGDTMYRVVDGRASGVLGATTRAPKLISRSVLRSDRVQWGFQRSMPTWVEGVVVTRVAYWVPWIADCLVRLATRAPKPQSFYNRANAAKRGSRAGTADCRRRGSVVQWLREWRVGCRGSLVVWSS